MLNNGKRTIGVFVYQVYVELQSKVSSAITKRAKELGYNVAFFTNFGGYGQKEYDFGEIGIADLPSYEDLAGVIIIPGTYAVEGLEDKIRENIKKRCQCPVVSIHKKTEDYYNVMIDDYTVLEDIIRHFIEDHGFTKINFLAGKRDFPDSDYRLECYKRILIEYGIPVEEDRIYYGDFWKVKPYEAVDYWLASSTELPEAIVCANDYMAITVCNALNQKGIRVPEDVAVSGCDNIESTMEYSPTITTVEMPAYELGLEAVNKIHKHNQSIQQEQTDYIKTNTKYRESCGCKKSIAVESAGQRRSQIAMVDSLRNAIGRIAYMSADLTGLASMDHIEDRIRTYVYENVGFDSFYMCLKNDWESYQLEEESDYVGNWDEMTIEIGIKHREDCDKIKFSKSELLPSVLMEEEPQVFYFTMLHHQERCFGYTAISFSDPEPYTVAYQAWMTNVSNALENVRIHSELNRLVYKLEDMYIRDELTGIYNRRGLDILGNQYLKRCKKERSRMMFFNTDMDKLKIINDNYGHASGDIAIKVVAEALQHASNDDEICIRCGGDEFIVIGMEYDEEKATKFTRDFINELDSFNKNGQYEFNVYVSYGWSLVKPVENTTIEECMIVADSRMYQQKYEKIAMRLKANLVR